MRNAPNHRNNNTMRKKKRNTSLVSYTSWFSPNRSRWSHLPSEILNQVVDRLTTSDRHRVRLICHNWRSITRQSMPPFPLPFEPPRLLLAQSDKSISFFDIFNSKSLTCSVPPPHRRARCFGYLSGWFFLVASDRKPLRACLFNPVLNAEVPLPDLQFPIIKAVLTGPPGFPNCVVAVMGRSSLIALCKPAERYWHVLDLGKRILGDIIFWRNQLCAVGIHGYIMICNFDIESRNNSILTVPLPGLWRFENEVFLVESTSGDLLAVIIDDIRCVWVCKLNQHCTWELVEQIGDQALFVGVIRSESVPVNRFLGSGLKENSIYWTSRKLKSCMGIAVVYSMDDDTMMPVQIPSPYSMLVEPAWVSPVIWP